jgi:hypothetical protein
LNFGRQTFKLFAGRQKALWFLQTRNDVAESVISYGCSEEQTVNKWEDPSGPFFALAKGIK